MFPFFHSSWEVLIFWLLVGHYLADFPLQGDFLSKAKDRHTEVGKEIWFHALFGHGMIHAGFVAFFTGSVTLGLMELIVHSFTDWLKCERKLGVTFHTDQLIHILCKVVWAVFTCVSMR